MGIDIPCRYLGNTSPKGLPYASAISSSASSSSSSVFSVDAASQGSVSSTSTGQSIPIAWESEEWSSRPRPIAPSNYSTAAPIARVNTFPPYHAVTGREPVPERTLPPLKTELPLPAEHRQHPRRSSTTANHGPPPQLVRQSERKVNFVDSLVDSATQMVEVIWPLAVPSKTCEPAKGRPVLPLRTFIQETLRRSRTSYSTLQVALYYLILIKGHVPKHDFTMEQPGDVHALRALQCGRRMFLAALILASKYLQDRNYSARAWSKISGLPTQEINQNEAAFLDAVNWKLHITDPVWERWQEIVLRHTPSNTPPSPGSCALPLSNSWRTVIPHLTPQLDMVEIAPRTPVTSGRGEMKPEIRQYHLRSPLPLPDGLGSQECTPTPSRYKAPNYLEPKPELLPPTPSLVRMGTLPTPNFTPQSATANTPAASVLGLASRRPSMCSAMAQVQSLSQARSCVDQFNPSIRNGLDAYHFPTRRPSLATSTTSSASSPESLVSDNSRSSRASSISSVSSASWAPNNPARLARLATCRSARLPYPTLSKCQEVAEYATSEPMSSPDLESFHIDDSETPSPVKRNNLPVSVPLPAQKQSNRKRGRSAADLQQNVSHLLQSSRSASVQRGASAVIPDQYIAQSFLLSEDNGPSGIQCKGLQSPKLAYPERRLPIQKDLGRKRTCASEAAQSLQRHGPGRWEGIL